MYQYKNGTKKSPKWWFYENLGTVGTQRRAFSRVPWTFEMGTPPLHVAMGYLRVESLGVAIKNHIHTTTSSSGNGGILCTKVNSHDAHDVSFHTSLFAVVVSCGPT
jgi:hypothetical protein